MADVDDPMNPENWFGEPGVCGSCVAWRPIDPGPTDEVAIGLCRLRPELRRVPATLHKCPKYNQRGGFTYKPGSPKQESGSRRRKAAQATIKLRNEAGELVDVTPTPKPRAERTTTPRRPLPSRAELDNARESGGFLPEYVPPPTPQYRPFPTSAAPSEIDLGDMSVAVFEAALVDLVRADVPGRRRDMASKYRHGGKVIAVAEDGESRTVAAHIFFGKIERLAKTLDALEEAIETHPNLGEEGDELSSQVRKMRGSFTTFNVLFADRSDYFSGKG